jgi:2-dehydropantoate 2-reductase
MKFTIVGAGAIGGVIGAYLAKSGEDVTFVDIAIDHVNVMQQKGLTIETNGGRFTVPVRAFSMDEFQYSEEKLDTVLLCVKAQHTKEAVNQFKHMLHQDSAVVSFQNGLCEQVIAGEVGELRTIGCFVNLFSDYMKPGLIQYGGVGSVYVGEVNSSISPRINQIVQRLSAWGQAQATDNILGYLWGKLAYGAILSATALTNETMADLLDDKANRRMFLDLAAEVLAVAETQGIKPMGFDDWEPSLAYPVDQRDWKIIDQKMDRLVTRLRSYTKTRSGIWRDLAVRKRKTEVPVHLSPVIESGEALNMDMTLTKAVLKIIMEIEDENRELSMDNFEALHRIHQEKIAT